jgi:hypothetical protein
MSLRWPPVSVTESGIQWPPTLDPSGRAGGGAGRRTAHGVTHPAWAMSSDGTSKWVCSPLSDPTPRELPYVTCTPAASRRPGVTYQLRPWAKSAEALDKEATIPD